MYITDNIAKLEGLLRKWGISELREVQRKAIDMGLLRGESLIVCAPSGSGKTLIGEIALALNANDGMGVYLVPFKALADEKFEDFRKKFDWKKVGITTGDYDVVPESLRNYDILVTTYERFDSILRADPPWLREIKVVVVDEIHMIGDKNRGPRLESLLFRLSSKLKEFQLIGLSATIANPEEIAEWLGCKLVMSNKRPVPLKYQVVLCKNKRKEILELSRRCLEEGGQALIFVLTRREAEDVAVMLSEVSEEFLSTDDRKTLENIAKDLEKEDMPSISKRLAMILRLGAAFHHAGLPHRDRSLVEKLFRDKVLKLLSCTTTLSAGVNLPARYVILKDVTRKRGKKISTALGANEFHQILGRAGRPGFDDIGIGVVLSSSHRELQYIKRRYFSGDGLDPVYDNVLSAMMHFDALTEQVLLRIFEEEPTSIDSLVQYFSGTFWGWKVGGREAISRIFYSEAKDVLRGLKEICMDARTLGVDILEFNGISVKARVQSESSSKWYRVQIDASGNAQCSCPDFKFRRRKEGELCKHLATLVRYIVEEGIGDAIPVVLDYIRITRNVEVSPISYLRIGGFISSSRDGTLHCTKFGKTTILLYIKPKTALFLRGGIIRVGDPLEKYLIELAIHAAHLEDNEKIGPRRMKRYVDALLMWIDEYRESEICDSCKIDPGDFQMLRDRATWMMHSISILASLFNRGNVAETARKLEERLKHGVREELLPILRMRVEGLGRVRARILFNAGFKTPEDLKNATLETLTRLPSIGKNLASRILSRLKHNTMEH
ncbi:MAG: DEAD/DEAH box helicase [Candidatus Baldrarchaeia archaeon]